MDSQIVNIPSGFINNVNDAVVGMAVAPGGTGATKYAGQLGKTFWLDDSMVHYDSSIGTVQGGRFRYVRLAAASAVPVIGQILYWDTIGNAVDSLFQVTTSESGSADTAMLRAGICLSASLTVGNYTVIQDVGPAYVKFRAVLTSAGAAGSRVFAAAAGGAALGLADVIDSANPALFSDVSKMMGRYIGVAQEAPAGGGLKRVYVNFSNIRG